MRTLADLCIAERCLEVTCKDCRRVAFKDPRPMVVLFVERGWSITLAEVKEKLSCSACKSKRVIVTTADAAQERAA